MKRDVGDVTILVNNAGVVSGKKLMDTPDEKVEMTFQVNTLAHFWVSEQWIAAVGTRAPLWSSLLQYMELQVKLLSWSLVPSNNTRNVAEPL